MPRRSARAAEPGASDRRGRAQENVLTLTSTHYEPPLTLRQLLGSHVSNRLFMASKSHPPRGSTRAATFLFNRRNRIALHEIAQAILSDNALVERQHGRHHRAAHAQIAIDHFEIEVGHLYPSFVTYFERLRAATAHPAETSPAHELAKVHVVKVALEAHIDVRTVETEAHCLAHLHDGDGVIDDCVMRWHPVLREVIE